MDWKGVEGGMSVCYVGAVAVEEMIGILLLPKSASCPWVGLCADTSRYVRMGLSGKTTVVGDGREQHHLPPRPHTTQTSTATTVILSSTTSSYLTQRRAA